MIELYSVQSYQSTNPLLSITVYSSELEPQNVAPAARIYASAKVVKSNIQVIIKVVIIIDIL